MLDFVSFINVFNQTQTWQALLLTFKLASLTAIILLIIATPLAWWLAKPNLSQSNAGLIRPWINAMVALPLILPPTVLGFYLLLMLSPQSMFGGLLQNLGLGNLAFSFTGLLIGSLIYSLPFAVHPLQNAFSQMGSRVLEVSAVLGATPLTTFFMVVLPHCRAGFITAALLSFAHTIGEFGVVLMIGGNIPGETQVLSTLIYGEVEALNYQNAHGLSLGLIIISLIFLWGLTNFRAR